ncbi:MAG: tRNA lysidine(34) synthetase TilS [Gemmatimonadota bacterium]
MTSAAFEVRFVENWGEQAWVRPGDRVVVACSGGMDSLVLLHLLRFTVPELGLSVLETDLGAAHFDHIMRPGSSDDAAWVRGLAAAWDVPLIEGRAPRIPGTEAEARRLRYDFLHGIVDRGEAQWVLTAHHADDQIETLLYRIVRGTGIEGLRGIPATRPPGVARPLLPFSRAEIETYAARHRLQPRVDPTNESSRFARNRIRHEILPRLDAIHPGARAAILRLARNSDRTSTALEALLRPRLDALTLGREQHGLVLGRDGLLTEAPEVRSELLRRAARSLGVGLSEAGTATAVEFISRGSSGQRVDLPGGLVLSREFDRVRLDRGDRGEGESTSGLTIDTPTVGTGRLTLGGRLWLCAWGTISKSSTNWTCTELSLDRLGFPLELRGWGAGDRTGTTGGTRKLKKLFVERKIPRSERDRIPVLSDSEGRVVWIPGTHLDPTFAAGPGESRWCIGVRDAGHV